MIKTYKNYKQVLYLSPQYRYLRRQKRLKGTPGVLDHIPEHSNLSPAEIFSVKNRTPLFLFFTGLFFSALHPRKKVHSGGLLNL